MSNGSARASPGSLISRDEPRVGSKDGVLTRSLGERLYFPLRGDFPALAASARRMYTEWLCEGCNLADTLTCLSMFNITVHSFQLPRLRFT